jgi:hypothetical protein
MGRADEVAVVCGKAYTATEWVLPAAMVHRNEGWLRQRQWSRGEKGKKYLGVLALVANRASLRHFLDPPAPPLATL